MGVQSRGQEDPLEQEMATPPQYSCLENFMGRGAWRATLHVVEKAGVSEHTLLPPCSIRTPPSRAGLAPWLGTSHCEQPRRGWPASSKEAREVRCNLSLHTQGGHATGAQSGQKRSPRNLDPGQGKQYCRGGGQRPVLQRSTLQLILQLVRSFLPFFFFWRWWVLVVACGSQFPDQGLNLGPLHWERSLSHWTTREPLQLVLTLFQSVAVLPFTQSPQSPAEDLYFQIFYHQKLSCREQLYLFYFLCPGTFISLQQV